MQLGILSKLWQLLRQVCVHASPSACSLLNEHSFVTVTGSVAVVQGVIGRGFDFLSAWVLGAALSALSATL
jgi:hypothetical protein